MYVPMVESVMSSSGAAETAATTTNAVATPTHFIARKRCKKRRKGLQCKQITIEPRLSSEAFSRRTIMTRSRLFHQSAVVNHGRPRPGSTRRRWSTMVNRDQPCLTTIDHGRLWSGGLGCMEMPRAQTGLNYLTKHHDKTSYAAEKICRK